MKMGSKRTDRLSDLSDSVILHILSFLNTKQALQTCILSTRWKNVTKLLPILRLYSSLHSKYLHNFAKLVFQVLSLRDHSKTLHTLEFTDITDFIRPNLLKRIVEYAVSHDIQLLKISITCDLQQFPPCLFSSQTLTSLDLCVHPDVINSKIFPNSLNFPALTTLTLRSFYFCARDNGYAEPFSAFSKLITLIIQDCKLLNARILCISSITLVNLTVDEIGYYRDSYICRLYTPNLYNLNYIGTLNQKLFRSCCFKHVYIDLRNECSRIFEQDYPFLLNLLVELGNIKSLTISFSTLQVLSFIPDLFKVKLTSLYNLESLQVKRYRASNPLYVYEGSSKFYWKQRTIEPGEVVNFLLQNSPLAKMKLEPRVHKNKR